MTKTAEETDPETCSKCGALGHPERMHTRDSKNYICSDCWEAVQDSKRAEQKDENPVH